MAYIGSKPADKALTSDDITDGIISTAKIANDAVDASKLDETDDYAFTGTITGAGESNTPAFHAYLTGNQSGLNDDTYTKINLDGEYIDTNSAYDTSTYKFTVPSGGAGKYLLVGKFNGSTQADQDNKDTFVAIYKNGSILASGRGLLTDSNSDVTQIESNTFIITTLAESDYIELYGKINSSANNGNNVAIATYTSLYGFKLTT